MLGLGPWSLATNTGELVNICRSTLMSESEKGGRIVERVQKPWSMQLSLTEWHWCKKLKNTVINFDEFADDLVKFAIISSSGASQINILLVVYLLNSIKNVERGNHEIGKLQFQQVIGTQTIKRWGAFLSNGNKKVEFFRILAVRCGNKP